MLQGISGVLIGASGTYQEGFWGSSGAYQVFFGGCSSASQVFFGGAPGASQGGNLGLFPLTSEVFFWYTSGMVGSGAMQGMSGVYEPTLRICMGCCG